MPISGIEQLGIELECVLCRFPKDVDKIKELYERSPTFREISVDYAEMVTWIEKYCRLVTQSSSDCESAIEVLKELEAEIMDCLKGTHVTVATEAINGAN